MNRISLTSPIFLPLVADDVGALEVRRQQLIGLLRSDDLRRLGIGGGVGGVWWCGLPPCRSCLPHSAQPAWSLAASSELGSAGVLVRDWPALQPAVSSEFADGAVDACARAPPTISALSAAPSINLFVMIASLMSRGDPAAPVGSRWNPNPLRRAAPCGVNHWPVGLFRRFTAASRARPVLSRPHESASPGKAGRQPIVKFKGR